MAEVGLSPSAAGVARYYGDLIDGIAVQTGDQSELSGWHDNLQVLATDVIMHSAADRTRLAQEVLAWASTMRVPNR